MPEAGLTLDELVDNVNDELKRSGRCVLVVSEGFDIGDIGESRDSFGHVQFSASKTTVGQLIVNYLNEKGLPVNGKARGQVPGTDQRSTAAYASSVDLDEAYLVGRKAVEIAATDGSGFMATILRVPGAIYGVTYDKVPLEVVANSERELPKSWIAPSKIDVTDDFVRYARPLVGEDWVSVPLVDGRPRYARIEPVFAQKRCNPYTPQAYRK
jgi:6-phosphofructokinase 1